MLTGISIRNAGVVIGGTETSYRASSYDVRIGQILTNDGELHANFRMPPQGIVQVISKERIKLPHDMTGLATVKTSLCNDGLLALNIGIIDPGYEGRISSFLVNFANVPRVLTRGEPFLRLQFVPLPDGAHTSKPIDDSAYIASRRQAAARFGGTFLNLSEEVQSAAKKEFLEWRRNILTAAGGAALILAVFTFFLNFGSLTIVKGWLQPTDTVRADLFRGVLNDQMLQLTKANSALAERLQAIEARLRPATAETPAPRP